MQQALDNQPHCRLEGQEFVDAVVKSHSNLVCSMAKKIRASTPDSARIDIRDLIQAGNVGLLSAIRCYHPDTGVPFEIYARFRVRGEILDTLRRLDAASRKLRHWQRWIRRTTRELSSHLLREPTEEEVSAHLGLELSQLRRKALAIRAASSVTVSTCNSNGFAECYHEQAGPADVQPDFRQSLQERRKIIGSAINQLPTKPRTIVRMYYQQECTMREIGETLSLKVSRISQIHKGALRTIARTLSLKGINSSGDL
jgi:RNA polymerase sigma factor for flagellar operon FliA